MKKEGIMRINSYNKFFAEIAKIMNTSVKAVNGNKVALANHVYLNVYRGVRGSLFIHDYRGIARITSCYDFEDFKTMKDLYERLVSDYSESAKKEVMEVNQEKDVKKGIAMKVLVACEESQRVTIEFRKLGHEAYSCDLLDCSGNHPEWHIKKDVTLLLNGNCIFYTVDGVEHEISGKWDMIIAFPPCTYLTVTGNRWFNYEKYGNKAIQRMLDRNDAIKFFMTIANADCDKIAIENPVGIMSTKWRKQDQIIQPFEFGDAYEKRTCLWLKGLQKLIPTEIVPIPDRLKFKSGKTMAKWYVETANLSKEQRALVRSKTFPGIAKAMATQWGRLEKHYDDYTSEDFINAGIAKECTECPADREGNRCGGKQWCKQTWKRYEAIVNPEWHHVSIATLANIDNDMLDEKRRNYMYLYNLIKDFRKYAFEIIRKDVYFETTSNVYRNIQHLYFNNVISFTTYDYAARHIQAVGVEKRWFDSKSEETFGYKESRRYKVTLR